MFGMRGFFPGCAIAPACGVVDDFVDIPCISWNMYMFISMQPAANGQRERALHSDRK